MRITFVIRSLDFGGAERQLVVLANGLAAKSHDVSVVTFYDDGKLAESIDARVRVHSVGKKGRWDMFGFAFRFAKLLRRLKPDVLHGYLAVQNILVSMCRPLLPGTRIVWGICASDVKLEYYDWLTRLTYRLEARLAGTADLIIANSNAGRSHYAKKGFPIEKIVVIPNGIDTDLFRPDREAGTRIRAQWGIPPTDKVVGVVARLDPMKGHPDFLRAAACIERNRSDVWFVCVGDGPSSYKEELLLLARLLGVDKKFILAGPHTDMRAVYNAFDVNVLASYSEGFPNVVAEAMACGVPCVVTDVGDVAWLVGDWGVIVQPADFRSLADGVERTLSTIDSQRCQEIRSRIVEKFDQSLLIQRSNAILSSG